MLPTPVETPVLPPNAAPASALSSSATPAAGVDGDDDEVMVVAEKLGDAAAYPHRCVSAAYAHTHYMDWGTLANLGSTIMAYADLICGLL